MKAWLHSLKVYADPRMVVLFFLGYSSGLPRLLIYSTLTFWLLEEGLEIESVGLFAATALPYSFKFVWAPFIDRLRVPVLGRILGLRRGWLFLTQVGLLGAIALMAMSNPATAPMLCALAALLVAFLSASQDIVVDAYRIESLEDEEQGAGAAAAVFGYRMGMLSAGAGALYIVAWSGNWPLTYLVMSMLMLVGITATLLCSEPQRETTEEEESQSTWQRLREGIVGPFRQFAQRRAWYLILAFVVLYQFGQSLANTMRNPLLADLEFSMTAIANIAQTWGLVASIIGIFLGGLMVRRYGIIGALWVGGALQMASNLMFTLQANVGHNLELLTLTIGAQSFSGGFGAAAFVAYLSALCHKKFTATQYALLTAVGATLRTSAASGAGYAVAWMGWGTYFVATTLACLPGLALLYWLSSHNLTGLDETDESDESDKSQESALSNF